MSDYGQVFSDDVARGLGLARRRPEEIIRTYREDPASAFTRMAELMASPCDESALPSRLYLHKEQAHATDRT